MNLNTTLRSVADGKREEIHVVDEGATVHDAVQRMKSRGIGALVVLGAGNRVAGIFSERDVLNRVVADERDPRSTRVAEVMTAEPLCVDATTTVADAMRVVSDRHIRHLPMTTGGKLEGLVSSGDLMAWVVSAQETTLADLGSQLRAASTRNKALLGLMIAFAVLVLVAAITI